MEKTKMMSFTICYPYQILFGRAKQKGRDGRDTWNVCEIRMHTAFWLGNPKERDHSEDLDVEWEIILKWINLSEDKDT